jgi:nucleoside-diphosphate-sugar epimerase
MAFWHNKHVVVTGGAGFLGARIVSKLYEQSAAAVVVPRSQHLRRDDHLQQLFDLVLASAAPSDVVLIHTAARVAALAPTCASQARSSTTT